MVVSFLLQVDFDRFWRVLARYLVLIEAKNPVKLRNCEGHDWANCSEDRLHGFSLRRLEK